MTATRGGKITGTRERLVGISQYFLSDPDPGQAEKSKALPETQLLPVLVDSDLTQALVYALARALHAQGLTALVLHVDSSLRSADPRSSSLRSQLDSPTVLRQHLREEIGGAKRPPRVCLIPVTDPRDPHLREYDHIVVATGASLAALKRGYLRIKHLTAAGVSARIGTIVVGASGDEDARRYFERLAAAAMRFLGRSLTPIGAVITSESDTEQADRTAGLSNTSLRNIVDTLRREGYLGDSPDAARVDAPDSPRNPPARAR